MSLSSVLKPVNDLTGQYLKLQSILKPEEITRKRLEIGVQGETILLDAYEQVDDEIHSFKYSRRNSVAQQEAFNQDLAKSLSTRKKESTEIPNNIKNIIKLNASQYLQYNILEDKIELFHKRIQELHLELAYVSSRKYNIEVLDLKFTPINKEIFAEEIREFEQTIKAAINPLEKFKDELKQQLEHLETTLQFLQQNKKIVQEKTILLNAYEKLDDKIQSLNDFQKFSMTQKEAFNQALAESFSLRKKESTEILNNIKDIIKPNASQYLQDNILEDKIALLSKRIQQLDLELSDVSSRKYEIEQLDLKLTPIDKGIFAEDIKEFDQGIKAAINSLEKFQNELEQELENLKKNLEDLQKNYRDNGYSRTSLKNQVWIDGFTNNNGHNKAYENQN